jgi:hypothetical protein
MVQLRESPACTGLFQELLLALLGYTGDVFVDQAIQSTPMADVLPSCSIHLADEIDWISSSERCTPLH